MNVHKTFQKPLLFLITIILLSIGLSGCIIGSEYDFAQEGDECGSSHRCARNLKCVEGICIDPGGNSDAGTDSDEDIIDAGDDSDSGDIISDGDIDGDVDSGTGCSTDETACGDLCCTSTESCINEECVPVSSNCVTDDDCTGDTYCYEDGCIPYGYGPRGSFNPECGNFAVAGLFKPQLQCAWTAPPTGDPYPAHANVLSTPLVVDFDFDNDPEVIKPSIVFVSYDGSDGSSGYYNGAYGVIRVIDGATCELQYNVGTQLNGCNTPSIADLNGDGQPDIVAHTGLGGIEAFTYDATSDSFVQLFHGHDSLGNNLSWGAQSTGWSGVAVHDINGDNNPEILSLGRVYDHTGLLISSNLSSGPRYPAAADLNRDGIVDMSTGAALYQYNGGTNTWDTVWSNGPQVGFIAYGDFGTFPQDSAFDSRNVKDGIAEIVIVGSGSAMIINYFGRLVFGPVSFPAGSGGGPPTVGDFDGDGRAEFSAASSDSISVFDPDCLGIPDTSTCLSIRNDGILWTQVSQDHSSNQTGSSLFDFEGDGRVEVVYADETFSRVYDGRTGDVLFSQWHSSCTWNENPIVADVDGDFNAELVIPSNLNCGTVPTTAGGVSYPTSHAGNPMDPLFRGLKCKESTDCASGICDTSYCRCTTDDECGGSGSGYVCDVPVAGTPGTGNVCRSEWLGAYPGIKVYADALDRWVASRTIWNQHAYSVTNITESGSVPPLSSWYPNWTDPNLNNFRQNVQGSVAAGTAPDITVGDLSFTCTSEAYASFDMNICNRGTQPLPPQVPVTIYDSDTMTPICQFETSVPLDVGQCESAQCVWTDAPHFESEGVTALVRTDDDSSGTGTGTGTGSMLECNETNNYLTLTGVFCEVVGK